MDWECSWEAGEGALRSVFEDSLDVLFKKGYREA